MPALIVSLLVLLLGYVAVTKGPIVLAAGVATLTIAIHEMLSHRVDSRLRSLSSVNFGKLRGDGDPWSRVPSEQKLLERALSLSLKRTELYNQYPTSQARGARLANQLGWI